MPEQALVLLFLCQELARENIDLEFVINHVLKFIKKDQFNRGDVEQVPLLAMDNKVREQYMWKSEICTIVLDIASNFTR